MSSAPAPQFEPIQSIDSAAAEPAAIAAEPTETAGVPVPTPPVEYVGVIHLTRTWVQYGIFGFAVLCIVIGAVEALFGR